MFCFNFSDLKLRWLIYTVLFGMVPIVFRLIVSTLIEGEVGLPRFAPSDFIAFGIVLQVSIFNEIKYHDLDDAEWKHRMMGMSAFFMLLYSGLYILMLVSEGLKGVKVELILHSSMICCAVSLLLCYVFYDRMSKSAS